MKTIKLLPIGFIALIFSVNALASEYTLYRLFDDSTPSEPLTSYGSVQECNLAAERMREDNPGQHFFCNRTSD